MEYQKIINLIDNRQWVTELQKFQEIYNKIIQKSYK